MVPFFYLPSWLLSKQKTHRHCFQWSREGVASWNLFDGLLMSRPFRRKTTCWPVRCPKPWWLPWGIVSSNLTRATSHVIRSKKSSTLSVPWIFLWPPSTTWSACSRRILATKITKQRLEKSWNGWSAATWCHWIFGMFPSVTTSQHWRGSSCEVRSGPSWRMQISVGASQDREMVEGVCVFFAVCTEYWTVFISFGTILQVQGQCHFFGKLLCCMTWPWTNTAGVSASKGRVQQIF